MMDRLMVSQRLLDLALLLLATFLAGCEPPKTAAVKARPLFENASYVVTASGPGYRDRGADIAAGGKKAAQPIPERVLKITYGSGVSVALKGHTCYFIVANHVVEGATSLSVAPWNSEISPSSEKSATAIWRDPTLDAALIVVDGSDDCYPAKLSRNIPKLMQEVHIFGQADHYRGAVTHGIVSAVWNLSPGGLTYVSDAMAPKGFSGGGAYTLDGSLIGIVVAHAIEPGNGLSFVVPICSILEGVPQNIGLDHCTNQ